MNKSAFCKYKILRRLLIFWTLFVGIGAVAGAVVMIVDPSGKLMGMDGMLPYFKVLPFSNVLFNNLLFSGIMLLVVNGITNLTAVTLLFLKRKSGIICGSIFGVTLMAWIVIQFVIFPFNFMSTTFFIIGFLQFVTGYACFVRYSQAQFTFNASDYPGIGADKTKLVVFFSRLGYTKKLAYEIANEQNAEICEITTKEKIDGYAGFWWCGRFAMHKWGMEIQTPELNIEKYSEIIICSPTWMFSVSAPIREFCTMYAGKINNVNYVITHFVNFKLTHIVKEMDGLLKTTHNSFRTFRCRFGKVKEL